MSKAAKELGVHPNSLRNWEKQGLIKPVRLAGGQLRYSMDELNKLLQSGQGSRVVRSGVQNTGAGF